MYSSKSPANMQYIAPNILGQGQGGAAGAALGNSAKSHSGVSSRVRRFALLAGGRELLPGERLRYCLRRPFAGSVDVVYTPVQRAAVYRGLMTCGSVWMCAVCSAKISERRRVELGRGLAVHERQGGRVLLCTYTIRHKLADDLRASVEGLLAARLAAKTGRAAVAFNARYGVIGTVRALEVTHGVNGWHPHFHELMFLAGDVDRDKLQQELHERWAACVERVGLGTINEHGLDVQFADLSIADYVAKFGHGRTWGPEHEVARVVSKSGRGASRSPVDLLAAYTFDQDEQAGRLWAQYALVFKGRRQLAWSSGLRARLGLGIEQTDEEVAAATTEDGVLLASLTLEQWRVVLANDARGEVLDVASSGDGGKLWAFLRRLGVPCDERGGGREETG